MTRTTFGLLALALVAADHPPIALSVEGEEEARIEVRVEVEGTPVAAVWDDTFAKLFAYFDRNGDGVLDEKEAARLPSARSLRQAMGNGFTPPTGTAPVISGKITPAALAAHYRAAGVGDAVVGVGRMPHGADLTVALLRNLDADGDGVVTEKEWKAAADVLKKLDKNDDELIGAGELVPTAVYPGAAGTVPLTSSATDVPDVVAKLPLSLLPAGAKNTDAAARWTVKLSEKGTTDRFDFAAGSVRVTGWVAGDTAGDALESAKKQLVATLDGVEPEPKGKGRRRAGGGLAWLTPIADRDGNGELDRKELDAWLDLQSHVARGQALLTVLDGGGLFELLDTNHDGALSLRELRGAWAAVSAAGCVSNGAFDAKKLPRVVLVAASHGYPRTIALDAPRGPAWFRAMDRNGDGDVSRREFTGPPEVFDKYDTDKDGLLSPEEAEKLRPLKK